MGFKELPFILFRIRWESLHENAQISYTFTLLKNIVLIIQYNIKYLEINRNFASALYYEVLCRLISIQTNHTTDN